MLKNSLDRFRFVAFLEGCSFLLLGITMILKYKYAMPGPNYVVGMAHGVLFILYGVAGFAARAARGWSYTEAIRAFIAGIIPGGTFIYDAKFLRGEQAKEAAARELQKNP